ncbi:MAG: YfhO family protein, partial [Syntrophomonadaceae bacterium]
SAGASLGALAAAALVAALALGLRALPAFAPGAALSRCPDAVAALAASGGRVVTPPMDTLWAWALGDGRFDAPLLSRQREALLGYTNLTCGVATVRTAAPLPTAAAASMSRAIGSGDDARPAGAAGGRALWTPFPPERLPSRRVGGFFRAPLAPYLPRLSWVRAYAIEPDPDRAWTRIASGETDLTRTVVLDRRPDPDPGAGTGPPMLLARVATDRPEEVVAEVTSNDRGLLVLADLFYPGWTAEENGRTLPIYRANGYFRAVALPAGTHRVVFRYRPVSVYAGLGLTALALVVFVALAYAGEPVLRRRTA